LFVVARVPLAVRKVEPPTAEIDAVGIPLFTLTKANLALAVAFDPSSKS